MNGCATATMISGIGKMWTSAKTSGAIVLLQLWLASTAFGQAPSQPLAAPPPPSPLPFQGDTHTIYSPKPRDYLGVADHRINGKAAGY